MNKNNILFWTATGLFSAFMIFSAYSYITSEEMKGAFAFWGFPSYFRIGLAGAKFLGALALILPFVPKPLKAAAYIGFGVNLISALVVHVVNDYHTYGMIAFAAITLALSYYSFTKLQKLNSSDGLSPEMVA